MSKEVQTHESTETLATSEAHNSSIARRIAKLINKISSEEIEKYEQSKLFSFPFYVDESILEKLNDFSKEKLSEIPLEDTVEFKSETRFSDHSTKRFDNFTTFLKKAGDKKDPERIILLWNRFSLDEKGEPIAGAIQVAFITEKKMENQESAPGDFHHAAIEVTISGSNELWVERTYGDIVAYVEATKLSGIYRPLWIFRNKWFIHILSQVIGFAGFFIGVDQSSKFFKRDMNLTKEQVLENIVNSPNIDKKIDLFASQVLTPSFSPWWEPIIIMGCGGITFAVSFYICLGLLPKLTPRSFIAIGLASIRFRSHQNVFKFLVFTLLFSGILVPIITNLIL